MDRRYTNQLLGHGLHIISITGAMLADHSVVGSHAKRIQLTFNDFCNGCRSTEEEVTVIHFLCTCPFLARYRLFGSPFLVSLTELSSIVVKDTVSFTKVSGWFSLVGKRFPPWFRGTWSVQRLCSSVASQGDAMSAHVNFWY